MADTAGIFISYRRDDATAHARAIYERLGKDFGHQSVFIDLEGLNYGEDFVDALEKHLAACQVVLAVMGRGWLDARNTVCA